MKGLKLPSFVLSDFPDLHLPLRGDVDLVTLKGLALPSICLANFPHIDLGLFPRVPGCDWRTLRLPKLALVDFPGLALPKLKALAPPALPALPARLLPKLRLEMGGSLMKFKLFLGFAQCISFFPVTFATIPWPENFLNLGIVFKLFAVDLFSMFGAAACNLSTGFYQQFLFSFALMPLIIVSASLAYACVLCVGKLRSCLCCTNKIKTRFTAESARVRLYTLLFMVVYALYTGVSTKLFVLFKCVKIQDTWFLAADMRIECFDEAYSIYRLMSFGGIGVFVIGIPVLIFGLLFRRRKWLYEETCPKSEKYKHVQVEKAFGSVYQDYTPDNYYFDLLDLGRRLLLTGGLILVGEERNTQIFLGLLLNVIWFGLVLFRRPYRAYWDNILSIVLSFQLVLIMLCGTALELNRLTPAQELGGDVYEKSAFEVLMFVFMCFIVLTAAVALVVSIPCLRERVVVCFATRRASEEVRGRASERANHGRVASSSGGDIFSAQAIANWGEMGAQKEMGQAVPKQTSMKTHKAKKRKSRRFSKHVSDDGKNVFTEIRSGKSFRYLPADGEIVEL